MSLRLNRIKDGQSATYYLSITYMIIGSTTKFCTLQANGSGNAEIIFNICQKLKLLKKN